MNEIENIRSKGSTVKNVSQKKARNILRVLRGAPQKSFEVALERNEWKR
jgi:hypothetical protein